MWSKGEARRRSGKFWNGVHKAASSLEAVAGKSRVSMATALIVPASLLLMMPTRMEVAMADPVMTQRVLQIEHVKIEFGKTFAEVEAALDRALPQLDPAIAAALTAGDEQRAQEIGAGREAFHLPEARSRCAATKRGPVTQGPAVRNRQSADCNEDDAASNTGGTVCAAAGGVIRERGGRRDFRIRQAFDALRAIWRRAGDRGWPRTRRRTRTRLAARRGMNVDAPRLFTDQSHHPGWPGHPNVSHPDAQSLRRAGEANCPK